MKRAVLWNDRDAAMATGGQATGSWQASGVAFDSRQVVPGDLFVALEGQTSDGHAYLGQAFDGGASAAMVRDATDPSTRGPLLLVPDTMNGLNDLARAARKRCQGQICAITGSVGKTGTKEMLYHVLQAQGATHASEKSFNNYVGTPLSLARMPATSTFGIFELGTNAPGEILPLAQLVRPNIAVITAIELVHSANFEGAAAIADEKTAIFSGLAENGIAVINGDGDFADFQADRAAAAGAQRIVRFGARASNDVRLLDWCLDNDGTMIKASHNGKPIDYRLGTWGHHQAINSLAVLAVADAMGADVEAAAEALASVVPPIGRGRRHHTVFGDGTILLIDESYNCSPAALRAALDVLEATTVADDARRIAVIGDMLELGGESDAVHAGFADELVDRDIDLVLLVGNDVAHMAKNLPADRCVGHVATAQEAYALLNPVLQSGDVVMIKGSRRIGLETVVEALLTSADCRPLVGNG